MTLEDSLGDILRKARVSANAPSEVAAQAAGLSAEAYARVEETAKAPPDFNWDGVARLLSLNGRNLARVAQGWLPKPVETTRWREFRMITTAGDDITVNCYLVWDEATREAALFDTGFDATAIFGHVDQHRLQLAHLFITHSHGDHIAAIDPIRARFPKVKLHSSIKSSPLDQRNRPNECVSVGNLRVSHRDTPGHAADGVTYLVGNWPDDAPHVAIVGDAIFAGSIGGAREHLSLARQKIRDEILSLPGETLICPGHGPLTTVSEQKENNPWFV
jgi:glyoxylase-like metal-dependent hydrolase (beta-lactamase superfamily II)